MWPVIDIWMVARTPGPMGGMMKLLPCGGAAGEQPAALMDALDMVDGLINPPKDDA
ncbi:hypothetical protein [Sandarakinorhabdus sp.]|uniref:hypothetical protein n=1 Tax=Sandarakinorhabdus sp. TaxID=1916663 RepID=UPI00286E7221|nr:hypothetical protein [Sandarakinorhabdus sp.]